MLFSAKGKEYIKLCYILSGVLEMKERNLNVPASYLVLMKDHKVLLLQRANTGYHDGDYSIIAGHVEKDETFTDAVIREARE